MMTGEQYLASLDDGRATYFEGEQITDLVNHPILLNNWMTVRETAFARVRAIETPTVGRQHLHINLSVVPMSQCVANVDAVLDAGRKFLGAHEVGATR